MAWFAYAMPTYDEFEWARPSQLAELARAEFPWCHYLATEVRFDSGIVRPAKDGNGTDPAFGPLHVVTAIQPQAEHDCAENPARMEVLELELACRGIPSVRVVGSNFDGTYSEESRAIYGLTDDEARSLGTRFGHVAIFAWRGPRWSVLACQTDRRTSSRWTWEQY